ncbi:putative FMN-binding domain-containing protein [Mucidula mucida]|nr:putative FMN-binding domain-containing protein [Mucidula mucida]
MYLHPRYAELDISVLHDFIQSNPLGILISAHPSSDGHSSAPEIEITHIPWVLDRAEPESDQLGRLRGHLARANPHAKALLSASRCTQAGVPVTVLFNGPIESYVTPQFYVRSPRHGTTPLSRPRAFFTCMTPLPPSIKRSSRSWRVCVRGGTQRVSRGRFRMRLSGSWRCSLLLLR